MMSLLRHYLLSHCNAHACSAHPHGWHRGVISCNADVTCCFSVHCVTLYLVWLLLIRLYNTVSRSDMCRVINFLLFGLNRLTECVHAWDVILCYCKNVRMRSMHGLQLACAAQSRMEVEPGVCSTYGCRWHVCWSSDQVTYFSGRLAGPLLFGDRDNKRTSTASQSIARVLDGALALVHERRGCMRLADQSKP